MPPVSVSYPGVYVEELPSGGPPSSGVATSIAAFIGRAAMGPVNAATLLTSWGDYQRIFGELSTDSAMSYAVSAFFNNGGGEAVAVRLFEAPDADSCTASLALTPGDLVLAAASPGVWGNDLSATVDVQGITARIAQAVGVTDPADLFNLTLELTLPGGGKTSERFNAVTLNPAYPARLLTTVLAEQSQLAVFAGGASAPSGATGTGTGGRDSAPLPITAYLGDENQRTGLYALEQASGFNILCIPPDVDGEDTPPIVYQTAAAYCEVKGAMLIIDPPAAWQTAFDAGDIGSISPGSLGAFGRPEARNSVVYFPNVLAMDPLADGALRAFPPCGYAAGIWAQADVQVGVWKAPAGLDAALNGIEGLAASLSDAENGLLNPLGINCLRDFTNAGPVLWGARTLAGADQLSDDYKYIPVRRLTLYIEAWLGENLRWAVFQPNDEALWSQLRLQVSTFMTGLWRQGAFFGAAADEAFFVKCDATTTTLSDIDAGVVNIQVGFAPIRPAEFIILTFQQIVGQSAD